MQSVTSLAKSVDCVPEGQAMARSVPASQYELAGHDVAGEPAAP